jgi:glycosyltransferase involved in cell wall biosynthesis
MGKKNEIIYLVTDSTVANKFGIEQIEHLQNLGYNVTLVCGKGKLDGFYTEKNYSVIQIENMTREINLIKDINVLLQLIRIIKLIKPTTLIYSTPKAALLGSISGRYCFVPIRVYQVLGARWQTLTGMKRFYIKFLDRLSLLLSTDIICVSDSMRILYQNLTRQKITVILNGSLIGVDKTIFNFQSKNDRKFILGYAGRIARDKGIEDLLFFFKNVKVKFKNLGLEIVGDVDTSDPVSSKVLDSIISDPDIRWIENLSRQDLAVQMRSWTLQIFPSKREGFGNVVIEAAAVGVPTICWDIEGVRNAIPQNLGHHLVPTGDHELFIRTIENYIKSPMSQTDQKQLSRWAIKNFQKEKVLAGFGIHISSLLSIYNSK